MDDATNDAFELEAVWKGLLMSSYGVLQYRAPITDERINLAVVVTDNPMSTYAGHRVTSDWGRVRTFTRLDDVTALRELVDETVADWAAGKPIYVRSNSVLRFTDFRGSTLPPAQLVDEISRLMLEGRV